MEEVVGQYIYISLTQRFFFRFQCVQILATLLFENMFQPKQLIDVEISQTNQFLFGDSRYFSCGVDFRVSE